MVRGKYAEIGQDENNAAPNPGRRSFPGGTCRDLSGWEGRSPGSLAWAGLANTYFWIDPSRNVTGVILMQPLPFADMQCLEAFAGFERGVYAGLDDGSGQKAA